MSDNYKKYYGQLVGCKIVDFYMEKDEDALNDWPVFILQGACALSDTGENSDKVRLVLSQDEEGNGGGFAFIEEVVEAQEKLREMRKVYEAKKKMETV